MIHVVSTGFASPAKTRCLASVRSQSCVVIHHYVEASDQDPPKSALQNRAEIVRDLRANDVVVELDGDDWFAHDGVLATVAALYENPELWVTYGSFRYADGRPGFAAPYETTDYRHEPWKATHLKTYRAGLFHRIKAVDLRTPEGDWMTRAIDQAVMLPLLEMAGPQHARFVPWVLYVYNFATSVEFTTRADITAQERAAAIEVRSRTPYSRLSSYAQGAPFDEAL